MCDLCRACVCETHGYCYVCRENPPGCRDSQVSDRDVSTAEDGALLVRPTTAENRPLSSVSRGGPVRPGQTPFAPVGLAAMPILSPLPMAMAGLGRALSDNAPARMTIVWLAGWGLLGCVLMIAWAVRGWWDDYKVRPQRQLLTRPWLREDDQRRTTYRTARGATFPDGPSGLISSNRTQTRKETRE